MWPLVVDHIDIAERAMNQAEADVRANPGRLVVVLDKCVQKHSGVEAVVEIQNTELP